MVNFNLRDLGFFFFGVIIVAIIFRPSVWAILLACLIGVSIYLTKHKNKDKKEENINKNVVQ